MKPPSFSRPGLLLLLPVLALTVMGALLLRQDRRMIEAEAKENMRAWAAQLAESFVREELLAFPERGFPAGGEASGVLTFRLDEAFQLIEPLGYPEFPEPVEFDLAALSESQREQWAQLQLSPSPDNCAALREAAQAFLASAPPAAFAPVAQYQLALACRACGDLSDAASYLEMTATFAPEALSPAGVPLTVLVRLRQAEMAEADAERNPGALAGAVERLESSALAQPSALTDSFLGRAEQLAAHPALKNRAVLRRRGEWKRMQAARKMHALLDPALQAARSELKKSFAAKSATDIEPAWLWIDRGETWLAQLYPDGNSIRVAVRAGQEAHAAAARFLSRQKTPESGAISLRLGRKDEPEEGSKSFAYAARPLLPAGPVIHIEIDLLHPERLFARQRRRNFWFGSLIAAAAGVAVAGWLAARRAFLQQARLNDLKSNFVSSVSHELRAPIGAVRLLAEGLERGHVAEPEKQREYFGLIVQECRRLGGLIENVLDFARIEQGRKEYAFEPADAEQMIQQTAALMQPHLAAKQLRLETRVEGAPAPVTLDGSAVQRALINLLDNAIKHSPPGESIVLGAKYLPEAFELSVEDRGPGIPSAERERIFERFYRIGPELRRETQGVGIGLSIVRHIVEAHGGMARLESEPGQGSRFTLVFPRRTEPNPKKP